MLALHENEVFLHFCIAADARGQADFIVVPWVPLKTVSFLTALSCRKQAMFCGDSSVLWIM